VGLVMAMNTPDRIGRLFAFAANTDLSGARPDAAGDPNLARFGQRAAQHYKRRSSTPDGFGKLAGAVMKMWAAQPNYSARDLAAITIPVAVVDGDHDEGIKREHTEYIARTIPGARLIILPASSHFAHLQTPGAFNAALLEFLGDR
jgi:pimeloyl-ACP methyl ester carboxylesterase